MPGLGHAKHFTCSKSVQFYMHTHYSTIRICSISNLSVLQVALLAHISPEPSHHSETLHTIQLASRIHRMRRKKMRVGGSSGGGSGSGGSSDENKRLGRIHDSGEDWDNGDKRDLNLARVQ